VDTIALPTRISLNRRQFYLLFPILFFLLTARPKASILRTWRQFLVIGFLYLSFCGHQTTSKPESAYYLLPSRFWELACGACLFQLQSLGYATFSRTLAASGVLWLGAFLAALAFLFSDPLSFPFPGAVLSVVGCALMIAGVSSPGAAGSLALRLLQHPFVVMVGKLSYSLYLWHWPIYTLFRLDRRSR
jgi:peptidoglycan/LPS O-acetylase OafA/YrhL